MARSDRRRLTPSSARPLSTSCFSFSSFTSFTSFPQPGYRRGLFAAMATLLLAAGCASQRPLPPLPEGQVSVPARIGCADLDGFTVAAERIGLPTRGAKVVAAAATVAGGSGAKTFGAYCRLIAEIAPVDAAAPPIRVQLSLPEA